MFMTDLIEDEELEDRLEDFQIWNELNGKLTTRVEFDGYRDAVFFANTVFSLAEADFHHPEVKVMYGAVEIDLWSHEEDGITEKDLELANKIEEKVAEINWD